MFSGKVGGNWNARGSTTIAKLYMQNADVANGIATAYAVVLLMRTKLMILGLQQSKMGFRVVRQRILPCCPEDVIPHSHRCENCRSY
jgi:hypothetical protein